LGDPAYAQQVGKASRQKAVQDYSWLAVGQRLTELYAMQIDERMPVGAAMPENSAADVRR
jgi:hypothetical protein